MDIADIPFLPNEDKPNKPLIDPITFDLKAMLARLRHEHLLKAGVFEQLWNEAECRVAIIVRTFKPSLL